MAKSSAHPDIHGRHVHKHELGHALESRERSIGFIWWRRREKEVEGKRLGGKIRSSGLSKKNKAELTKDDILEDPQYSMISQRCAESFEGVHASLMVPLVFQDQVIGLINLGEKKSGKSFNREDVELIRALANQGAVAIENARLFKENLDKQRMEEELEHCQ